MIPMNNVFIIPIALTAVFLLVACDPIENGDQLPTNGSGDPPENDTDPTDGTQTPFTVTYENGTLFYSVDVMAPTPCHAPRAEETILESYPVQIRIDIGFDEPDPGQVCAQVLTERTVTGRISIDHEPGRVTIVTPDETHEVTL